MTSDDFWAMIDHQLTAAASAIGAAQVCDIMPPDPDLSDARASGFFAGNGGDGRLDDALRTAGWSYRWVRAYYYWCMEAPDGSALTYVEGDLYIGEQVFPETDAPTSRHATPDHSTGPADSPARSAAHVAAADFPGPPAETPPTAPTEPVPESPAAPPTPERSPRHGAR